MHTSVFVLKCDVMQLWDILLVEIWNWLNDKQINKQTKKVQSGHAESCSVFQLIKKKIGNILFLFIIEKMAGGFHVVCCLLFLQEHLLKL